MKKLYPFFLVLIAISGCGPNSHRNKNNRKNDYSLADSLHFEHAIIDDLRKITSSDFTRLITKISTSHVNGRTEVEILMPDALEFEFERKKSLQLVLDQKKHFSQKGYFMFRSKENFGGEFDKIVVLKSSDQFDILKYMATNGTNYGIDTDSIITKLRIWHKQYPFEIIGADFEAVEVEFVNLPANLNDFAKEVYRFCPDIVDQGTESIDRLADEIRRTNKLYLWWD